MAKKKKSNPILEDQIDLTQNVAPETELPSTGLGDTVAKITKFFGIEPCDGCKSRQARYNKLFPYLNPSRHLDEEETVFIDKLKAKNRMESEEANRLFSLYNQIFVSRNPVQRCNCPGTILKLIERLHVLAHINDTE
jgi:hypothetical protein